MKILLLSHSFAPKVGGIESVSESLAREFVAAGHGVRLVTRTPANGHVDAYPFEVIRSPGVWALLALARWCDIFFQNNPSLQTLYPLLFLSRPFVVAHQTWVTRVGGSLAWQDHVKRFVIRFGVPLAISTAVAKTLPVPAEIIGNTYRDDVFRRIPDVPRSDSLVFLGRLVSDKGVDVLISALAKLKESGITPRLSIIGDGPDRIGLEEQAKACGVAEQITWAGQMIGELLVRELHRHRVMVVPSRLPEPYGVVALEGIACGCFVVGSASGGLQEAIGPCGLLFPNGDVPALVRALRRALGDRALQMQAERDAEAHLVCRRAPIVAAQYLYLFERTLFGRIPT